MKIDARLTLGWYCDDPTFDMYYEPILDLRANKGMAILMFQGICNFRCKYCFFHNMKYHKQPSITMEKILSEIKRRDEEGNLPNIDIVLITGAECTRFDYILDIAREIKGIGKRVHIHTNGTNPTLLESMFSEKLIDFVAMDIKGPQSKYKKVTGANVSIKKIDESIKLVKENSPEYKFRTTVCRELLSKDDIIEIAAWLDGAQWYELKGYWDSPIGRGHKKLSAYTHEEMVEMVDAVSDHFVRTTLLEGRRGVGGA